MVELGQYRKLRCIDYLLAERNLVFEVSLDSYKCSDHKIVSCTWQCFSPFVHLAGMKPTLNYSKPAEVSADVWMAAFQAEWQHVQIPNTSGNANTAWHWFCETAENIHKKVFLQFGGNHRQCWTRNKGTSPQLLDKGTVTTRASSARSIRIRRARYLIFLVTAFSFQDFQEGS